MAQGYALITGATEGIGRELAGLFARDHYPLVLVARNKTRLDAVAQELGSAYSIDVKTHPLDLSFPEAAEELVKWLDEQKIPVEVLVNNAGFGAHGLFHEVDWNTTEEMLDLNMTTPTYLTRLLIPGMFSRGRGRILNVASTAAFQPGPFMACYFASKAYILSLTEAIAEELSGTGVTVTAFCPGPTRTQFQKRAKTEHIRENAFNMDAVTAARAAYHGMKKGKRLVIPGLMNKLHASLVRLLPRRLLTKIARFLEEK